MSTTIDQKVVEMRFDNRHFERNTRETMSTLDKLKQKLNLSGASKGLENINTSANKINMNGLSNAVQTVGSRFSALEVVGVTALANISNSAINAAKNMASALTIQPVTTGFNEYELKMDSVKTIMASTGESIETVNKYLEELNTYSDQTIYSFSDMTQNIGKFTNAGVKLKDAVMAIKGISNEAAVSGANANEASRAMYNFAQALSAGYVKLIDWKSIENANMATVEFKQQLLDTAVALGTVTKSSDGMYKTLEGNVFNATKNFNEVLQDQWMTSEVLVETLKRYADETTDIGKKAKAAAQDVTKLSQVFDIAKEVAQSGWAKTWEIVFGDLETAKKTFTRLSEFITNIQMKFINFRNVLLDEALSYNPFSGLLKKLDGINKVTNKVDSISKSLEYYQHMVSRVWEGDWDVAPNRYQLLANEGHDYRVIQSLVNKGYQYKLTVEDVIAAEKQYGITTTESAKAASELSAKTAELTDEKLKELGLTDEEIAMYRELEKQSKLTGKSIEQLIKEMEKVDGRTLLMESLANVGKTVESVFNSVGKAWKNAFPAPTALQLYNIIEALNKFSTTIRNKVEKNADKLTRTLQGLFAILDMITMFIGGGLRLVFTILKSVLGAFDLDILSVTASIGDAIVAVRDWIEENNLITIGIKKIIPYIKSAVTYVKEWVKNNETIANSLEKLKSKLTDIKESLQDWFAGLKETDNIPKYILQGLVNGLKNGIGIVTDTVIGIGKAILDAICKVLGIHSPSREFFEIGTNIIQGLINGLQNGLSLLWGVVKGISTTILNIINKIDFGKILAAGIGIGMLVVAKKMVDTIETIADLANRITAPLQGLGDLLSGWGSYLEDSGKAKKLNGYANIIKSVGISIALLAGSIYLLSKIDHNSLWDSVLAVGALATIVGVLAFAISKMGDIKGSLKMSTSLLSITTSLFIIALAMKQLSSINPGQIESVVDSLLKVVGGLALLMIVIGTFIDPAAAANIDKVGKMIKKIAWALLILVVVIKISSMLKAEDLLKGLAVVTALSYLVAGLIAVSHLAGTTGNKTGKMISKIAFALLILIGVIKLASMLEGEEIIKGIAVISALGTFISALMFMSVFAGENAAKAGLMMLMISASLAIIVGVIKQIASLGIDEIVKGLAVIGALSTFMTALIFVSAFAGKNAIKAGSMLLMVSSALLILTGVLFLLSKMDGKGLYKALGIITVLELLFGGLIYVSQYSKDCMKTIITITVALTILIAAIIGLTFIDSDKLLSAAGSLSVVMSAFGLLIASTKFASGGLKNIVKTLTPLLGVVAILAGIIVGMSKLKPESVLSIATALSTLLLSLLASLAVLKFIGATSVAGIGALATLTVVVALLAGILGVMAHFKVDASIETAVALSTLLLAMSGALVVLGVVGAMGPAAFIGIAALATLIVGIGGIIVAIGALFKEFPMLEDFLNRGIPVLEKIGYALGSFVGNIMGGMMAGVSNGLPTLGNNLSDFMKNIEGFIQGAKNIDDTVVNGVLNLSKAIVGLSAADFISNISSFLSGGGSFGELGTQLSEFIKNSKDFIEGTKNIDPSIMKGVKTLSEAVKIITSANLIQSITSWLTGNNSLDSFGTQLGGLGTSMRTFTDNLGTFDESKVTTVNCACKAIKSLAEAADKIPNSGGWAAAILGDNSLASFGHKLPGLGTHLNQFLTNLGTFDESKVITVKCAGNAIKALAKAANEIPNDGGLAGLFTGNNDISVFGHKLPGLGTHLNQFLTNLGTFDESKVLTVKCAGNAIKALAKVGSEIPNEGGVAGFFAGNNDLGKFGEKLPGLATNITSFVNNLGTFSEAQVVTVISACSALKAIAKLGEIDVKDTGKDLNSFGKNMVKFAGKIKSFVVEIGEVGSEGISSAIKKTKDIIAMAKSAASTDIESLQTFGKSLKKVATDGVKGFVKEFSGESPKADAEEAVGKLLDSVVTGAEDKKSKVTKKFKTISQAAIDAITTKELLNDAKQAGADLVVGFANGIKGNKQLARLAGSELGRAALNAAKEALDEHSPSREAFKVGNYFGEGLVLGIRDYESTVYNAGYGVAEYAKDGLSRAISSISDLINNDMDAQPTIRPVLDLSEIESGANSINSMLNSGLPIGVASNLRAINYGMNSRLQNGANSDVVSAIDKLRKGLGNVGGTTNNYNVNGVSYDGESDVANAVQTLVRAATRERRT